MKCNLCGSEFSTPGNCPDCKSWNISFGATIDRMRIDYETNRAADLASEAAAAEQRYGDQCSEVLGREAERNAENARDAFARSPNATSRDILGCPQAL